MRTIPESANRADWPRLVAQAVNGLITSGLGDVTVIRSSGDLPPAVGGEHVLPTGTVLLTDTINIGSNALRLSEGTLLRGFGGEGVVSSATGGVVRVTNVDSAVVMREFAIIATGGPCINLVGPADQQLNMFFVGMFGVAPGTSIGTVSGFDVQGFKDCYFEAPDGLTLTGTTNKLFISQCPFYGLASGNAAITLDSALNARRADIVTNFFKHDPAAIPIRAEVGYTVGYGRVFGTMLDGPTTMLDGLASSDDNWFFKNNDLVQDSRVAAQSVLDAPATTVITTVGAFVDVTGTFTVTALTQRFILSGNELEYTGGDPVLISLVSSFTIDPAFNDRLAFRVTKNGATLPESETFVEQGAGTGSSPRNGTAVALIELLPGDTVGLAVANLTSTNDVPWLSATYAVTA